MQLRFKLRWLMVLVALVAIGIGPAHCYVQTLRQRSREYADVAKVEAIGSSLLTAKAVHPRFSPAERDHARTLAAWRAKRSAAYTRAASHPWIVVTEVPEPVVPAVVAEERETPWPTSRKAMWERGYAQGAEEALRAVTEIVARRRREAEQGKGRAEWRSVAPVSP